MKIQFDRLAAPLHQKKKPSKLPGAMLSCILPNHWGSQARPVTKALRKMSVKFILSDALGTLLRICDSRHTYRQILKKAVRQGRRVQATDPHRIMNGSPTLTQAVEHFSVRVGPDHLAEIQSTLESNLSSIINDLNRGHHPNTHQVSMGRSGCHSP